MLFKGAKFLLVLAFLGCFSAPNVAQQLVQERLYRVDGNGKVVNTSAITRQGNIIMSGNYIAQPGFKALHMLVKPNTDTLWLKSGQLLVNGDQDIKQTPDNGFIFFGMVSPAIPGNFSDLFLQKLNANGISTWSKTYPAGGSISILMAADSGYFLGGLGGIPGKNSLSSLSRTDALGNIKWQKNYTWSVGDYLMDMKYTPAGNIIIAGRTYDANFHASLKLLLVNQNGDSLRGMAVPTYNPARNEAMNFSWNSVTPLSDNGFLVTGIIDTTVGASTKNLGMIVKVNANLQPVWRYIHRTNPVERYLFTKSQELTDGSVLVLSSSYVPANNQFKIHRFSSTGNLLNTYTFTSAIASKVTVNTFDALADSTYLIGAGAEVTPAPNYTSGLYVAKVRLSGIPQALHLPVVTGITPGYAITKADLGQSYPNPTASEAIIPFNLPKSYRQAHIIIREIATGREVKSYKLKRNASSLKVDLSNFSNGLYLYSLVIDEKPVAIKKLAVMK